MIRLLVAMEREGEALALPFELIGIGADSVPSIAPDDIIQSMFSLRLGCVTSLYFLQ